MVPIRCAAGDSERDQNQEDASGPKRARHPSASQQQQLGFAGNHAVQQQQQPGFAGIHAVQQQQQLGFAGNHAVQQQQLGSAGNHAVQQQQLGFAGNHAVQQQQQLTFAGNHAVQQQQQLGSAGNHAVQQQQQAADGEYVEEDVTWVAEQIEGNIRGGNARAASLLLKLLPTSDAAAGLLVKPFTMAVERGMVALARKLLLKGAEVDMRAPIVSPSGGTIARDRPVTFAARMGNAELVQLLLEHGAKPYCDGEDTGDTPEPPLVPAVLNGHVAVAKLLLDYGTPVEGYPVAKEERLLGMAAAKRNLAMVQLLVEKGAAVETAAAELEAHKYSSHSSSSNSNSNSSSGCISDDSIAFYAMEEPNRRSTPLFRAVAGGYLEVVGELLDRGAAVDGGKFNRPLVRAAEAGSLQMVQLLLGKGAAVNVVEGVTRGITPLYAAVVEGHIDIARELLKAGADAEGSKARRPLAAAAESGRVEMVQLLLECKASLHLEEQKQRHSGGPALHIAVQNRDVAIMSVLLAEAEVAVDVGPEERPLSVAAGDGWVEGIELLLQHGAALEAAVDSMHGGGPLYRAARAGFYKVVELLLARGAKPDGGGTHVYRHPYSVRQRPLHAAIESRNIAVVKQLVEAGAALNAEEDAGWSPLHVAMTNPRICGIDIIDYLLKAKGPGGQGPHINACHGDHGIALLQAMEYDKGYEVVEQLLQGGAKVDLRRANSRRPLQYADGDPLILRLLLPYGAKATDAADRGMHLLHKFCEKANEEGVRCLVNAGAAVDIRRSDDKHWRPLQVAVREGHSAIVKLLLSAGAAMELPRDGETKMPMRLAARFPRSEKYRGILAILQGEQGRRAARTAAAQ